jgi:hypothetical protein
LVELQGSRKYWKIRSDRAMRKARLSGLARPPKRRRSRGIRRT